MKTYTKDIGRFLLLTAVSSGVHAFDTDWIWEVSCKEKEHGTLYQYRVSTDMFQKRIDLGPWSIEPFQPIQELLISGSDTHLYISSLGDSVRDPTTIHLTWWNYTNPSNFNSYILTPSWSPAGELSATIQYLNCVADKNPQKDFNNRLGFITRNGGTLRKRHLDGSTWTEHSKPEDEMRLEFIKQNEAEIYEYLRSRRDR